jgi:protein-disulfide isomerase
MLPDPARPLVRAAPASAHRTVLVILAMALAAAACTEEPERTPPQPSLVVRDSIRVRRSRAMQTRPDTFGQRVDSLRILHAAGDAARSAPWVVVISDFQCDECRHFAMDVLPALRRDIVEQGTANLAFVNNPQDAHFNARFAALAALCAASAGHFWEMHDSLFATMPQWRRNPDPRPYMNEMAVAIGVPAEQQRDCVDRNRLLALLEGDLARSAQSGAVELPAVFVGDRRLARRELTLAGIRRAIAEARGER